MSAFDLSILDLIGALLGFLLTVFIFSYIVGDNVFFRIATHLFVGVAAGYVAAVVIQNIILPQMIWPFFSDNRNEKIFAILFLDFGRAYADKDFSATKQAGESGNRIFSWRRSCFSNRRCCRWNDFSANISIYQRVC